MIDWREWAKPLLTRPSTLAGCARYPLPFHPSERMYPPCSSLHLLFLIMMLHPPSDALLWSSPQAGNHKCRIKNDFTTKWLAIGKSVWAVSEEDCVLKCTNNKKCQSFRAKQILDKIFLCTLTAEDKLIERKGWQMYAGFCYKG